MLTAYWGVAQTASLVLPDSLQGWLLLLGYLLLFLFILLRDHHNLQQLSWREWLALLLLGSFAVISSQLFPISLDLPEFGLGFNANESVTLALLAAVPSLIAGIALGPIPALLVGLGAGLGRAIGYSHQIYDLFHWAFAAWIAGCMLQNRYRGRLYGAMRVPVVSGTLGQISIAFLAGFTAFVIAGVGLLGRIDVALAEIQRQFVPLLLEGLAGGAIVTAVMLVVPSWRHGRVLTASPAQRSVRAHLLTDLVFFSALAALVIIAATFLFSTYIYTKLSLAEMAASANAAAAQTAELTAQMERNLVDFSNDQELREGDRANARAVGRFLRTAQQFEQVLLVNGERIVAESYADESEPETLSRSERQAVEDVLATTEKSMVAEVKPGGGQRISMVVPVHNALGGRTAALLGRVKSDALSRPLNALVASDGNLSAAIVDAQNEVVVGLGEAHLTGLHSDHQIRSTLYSNDNLGGRVVLNEKTNGTRELAYVTSADVQNWRVLVAMPYEVIVGRSLAMAIPLMLALVGVSAVLYARLANYGRGLSGSITELTRVSRGIATGESVLPRSSIERDDELGELGHALIELQRGVKQRLDELNLLLAVSSQTSTSIDLAESFPLILQGALKGTGATGARAVVLNPNGGRPLAFGEGPSGGSMEVLDRSLMVILRREGSVSFHSPQAMLTHPDIASLDSVPVKALCALALQTQGRFLGFLAIGYGQSKTFSQKDLALLQTLAGQAAAVAEKSYLFTHAEGGRRRLAAVLASTAEAVIVTDQSSRILMINRAMELAFQVRAKDVVGRAVADVIDSPALVNALSGQGNGTKNLEIVGQDRKTYFANISTIVNHQGKRLGRVAVLHDVTHLKEVDRMKSEFVDNVSHDLRTPLTVLSGYASALALMDDLTSEQRHYADSILQGVERMIGLVEDLLDLGRIEAGVDLVFEDIDLRTMLQELADEQWLYAHDSGIRLHVRTSVDLPLIRGDRALLNQAVSNLLTNGFKYAPNSGDMTLAAELRGREVVISVRDRGPGIATQDQLHLFEKFYRVKRHGSGRVKGSGLGLAIVKRIAERHGGHAWCESELGKGSTFHIALPVE